MDRRARAPSVNSTALAFWPVLSPFGEQTEDGAANSEQRERGDDDEEDHAHCVHWSSPYISSLAVAVEECPEFRLRCRLRCINDNAQ